MYIKKCITNTRQFLLANELTRHQCGSNKTVFTVCVSCLILPIKDGGVGQFKPFKAVITDSVVCPAVHLKYSRWYNRLLITSCENKPDCHGSPYFLPAIHRVVIQWRKKSGKLCDVSVSLMTKHSETPLPGTAHLNWTLVKPASISSFNWNSCLLETVLDL